MFSLNSSMASMIREKKNKPNTARTAQQNNNQSAVFGRVSTDVQLEFLHGVDDRIESHLTGLGLQNTDSVVEVFVGARPASIDPRQQRPAARQGDARGECDEGNEIAPIEGQRFELRLADVIAH